MLRTPFLTSACGGVDFIDLNNRKQFKPMQNNKVARWACLGAWLVCSTVQAAAPQAQQSAEVPQIKVLQSIPSGQWELKTRSDPQADPYPPELGCMSADSIARDLLELVELMKMGQVCTARLTTNTDTLGVLELRCNQGGKTVLPAVMEFQRPTSGRVQVVSQLQMGTESMRMEQDYRWKGACLK